MQYVITKLKILNYLKSNTDNNMLVSYPEICCNISNTTDSYIAIALRRLVKENLIFHNGTSKNYRYGITIKGLRYLKAEENKQEIHSLTLLLKQIAALP
jgi:predicted MarR family transcription regulator